LLYDLVLFVVVLATLAGLDLLEVLMVLGTVLVFEGESSLKASSLDLPLDDSGHEVLDMSLLVESDQL